MQRSGISASGACRDYASPHPSLRAQTCGTPKSFCSGWSSETHWLVCCVLHRWTAHNMGRRVCRQSNPAWVQGRVGAPRIQWLLRNRAVFPAVVGNSFVRSLSFWPIAYLCDDGMGKFAPWHRHIQETWQAFDADRQYRFALSRGL